MPAIPGSDPATLLLQLEAVGIHGVFPEVTLRGLLPLGREVAVYQPDEALVVARVLGAGPVAAVDESLAAEGLPEGIQDGPIMILRLGRGLGNASLIESGNLAPDIFVFSVAALNGLTI